eukprot:12019149-Karenia_brevis.AAC.1
MFKAIFSIVLSPVTEVYASRISLTQFGAVNKRGADFATHVVLTATAVAKTWKRSIFVLFVDLVKAFDRVVREIALGWPNSLATCPLQYLQSLGLSSRQARWVFTYLATHGP